MATDLGQRPSDADEQSEEQKPYDNEFWGMVKRGELGEAVDPDQEDSEKASTPEQLATAEQSGEGNTTTADQKETEAVDRLGHGYKSEETAPTSRRQRLGRVLTRRRMIGGGLAGGAVGAALAFAVFSSGPFQIIHMGQLLQKFHFSNQEDAADNRLSRISRYLRYQYRGTPERTRLGSLGNAYADKIERKLNKSGVESAYTPKRGYFDGYIIDPLRIPDDSPLADLQNMTPAEIRSELAQRYEIDIGKIDVDTDIGQVRIAADDMGYFQSKRFVREILQDVGYSKVMSAIRSRIMVRRGGATLHPIQKLDRKILDSASARYNKWKEDRQNRIQNGVEDTDGIRFSEDSASAPDVDGDGDIDGTAGVDEVAQAADEVTPPRIPGEAPEVRVSKVRSSLGKAGGVTAVIGTLCAVRAIADNVDAVKFANVTMPLLRLGTEAIGMSGQLMSGQDIDMEQVSHFSKFLSDPAVGSWTNAASIQAEQGLPRTGPGIAPEARISEESNVLSEFLDGIPGLGPVCNAAGSIFGQVVTTAIGLLTGPVGEAAGQAFSYFAAPAIFNGVVRWLAGEPISLEVAGANYGNFINYGARLAANDSAIAGGGVALSPAQSAALKTNRLEAEKEDMKYSSVFERYLDPYNSSSLASKVIDKQDPEAGQALANVASMPLKFTSLISSSFSSLFAKAHAAEQPYDYGFAEYGFSAEDLDNADTGNPFANADNIADFLNDPLREDRANELIDRARSCFGIELTKQGGVSSVSSTKNYKDIPGSCTERSQDWLRVRMYIFDTQLMESMACYEGSDESCGQVGMGNTSTVGTGSAPASSTVVGDPYTDSSQVPCANGTRDLGLNDGYVNGQKFTVRLCSVPNIPSTGQADNPGSSYSTKGANGFAVVNSRMSGAWYSLANDAKSAGISLTAYSSFRSMTHQQALCRANAACSGGDYTYMAKPGGSSHQAGTAIDFAAMSVKGGDSCAARATMPNNASWAWLRDNAERYGIKQYSAEAWHWDALPTANRCGGS